MGGGVIAGGAGATTTHGWEMKQATDEKMRTACDKYSTSWLQLAQTAPPEQRTRFVSQCEEELRVINQQLTSFNRQLAQSSSMLIGTTDAIGIQHPSMDAATTFVGKVCEFTAQNTTLALMITIEPDQV